MCRNIRTLFNFKPPATEEEVRASALQFVRKLSGTNRPSRANEVAFHRAVDEVTEIAFRLVHSLVTTAPPRDRGRGREHAPVRATVCPRADCLELSPGLRQRIDPADHPRLGVFQVLREEVLGFTLSTG